MTVELLAWACLFSHSYKQTKLRNVFRNVQKKVTKTILEHFKAVISSAHASSEMQAHVL